MRRARRTSRRFDKIEAGFGLFDCETACRAKRISGRLPCGAASSTPPRAKLRSLFRRSGIDVEAVPHSKPAVLVSFGMNSMCQCNIVVGPARRRVYDQIVRWIVEHAVRFHQQQLESRARFSNMLTMSSRRQIVALGESQVSKGNRGAYGQESENPRSQPRLECRCRSPAG